MRWYRPCLVLALCAAGTAQAADSVVATVGRTQISAGEVQTQLGRFPDKTRRQVLDLLIARELLRLEGEAQGLGKNPQLAAELAQFEFQALLQLVQDREAGAAQIGEGEIEKLYREWGSGEEVRASHILCPTEEDARTVLSRLQEGASFAELAKERSIHKFSSLVGGEMGYMRKDMLMPEFREQVWALAAGQLCPEPLQTRLGFHVVKMTERRKLSLDSLRSALVDELQQQRRQNLRSTLGAALRDSLGFVWQAEVAQSLLGREKATPTSADSATLIARWEGGSLTVAEYLMRSRIYGVRNTLADTAAARKAGEQLTLDDLLVAGARRRGYDQAPELVNRVRSKEAEHYAQQLFARQMKAEGPPSDSLLHTYFAQHHDHFLMPAGVQVQEILVDDQRLADSLKTAILAGADMGELAALHTRRRWARESGGDLGLLTPKTPGYGELLPLAFAAEPGQLQGPVKQGGFYALFRVTERVPPRPATFEEAQSALLQRLQEEAMDRFIAALRLKYAAQIHVDDQALGE